jgi:hypothetical protein
MDDAKKMMWKEAIVTCFKARNLPSGSEESGKEY